MSHLRRCYYKYIEKAEKTQFDYEGKENKFLKDIFKKWKNSKNCTNFTKKYLKIWTELYDKIQTDN